MDRNIFLFTFQHEVDVKRVWDKRPWSFKGEHVILKKVDPAWSLNEIDFSEIDFWVQIHGLPLNRQNESNLKMLRRRFFGDVIEVDLAGSGDGAGKRFVRIRARLLVNQPLPIGFPLVHDLLSPLWIPFKFEKLRCFCYGCGRLGHDIKIVTMRKFKSCGKIRL